MIHARKDYMRIQDPENKIADDEPVFLIRAKDVCMIYALESWIARARFVGVDDKMINAVIAHIDLVKKWQKKNGCKTPDM